jgi:tyrosyl-tRNA synthetase
MKKSFCEPGNISFCPPISIAYIFALQGNNISVDGTSSSSSFTVKRSPENGGDRTYTTLSELESDFVQGEKVLHPGDLKASITPVIVTVIETISKGLQSDKEVVTACKTLKAFSKKKK